MNLDLDVLEAAVIGLLIEDGEYEDVAREKAATIRGLGRAAPPDVARAVRRVASVALTLEAHGILKERSH